MFPLHCAITARLLTILLASHLVATPLQTDPVLRPFTDYQDTGFVVMAAFDDYGAGPMKRSIASHLPADVVLILYGYASDARERQEVLDDYARVIPAERIRYLSFRKTKNMFWSRDAMPLPSVDRAGNLVLTDAKYWGGFEPDAGVAALFGATLASHAFRFEGGNLMANHVGDCFTVATKDTKKMPDALFTSHYGCRTVVRLPRRGGIGHIDERARFVNETTILHDTAEYDAAFSAGGFKTVHLPRPKDDRESYVNALIVNGVAFVPQFGRPDDAAALRVYRDLGFTPIGLEARTLAAKGHGLIHCLAMNYPRPTAR